MARRGRGYALLRKPAHTARPPVPIARETHDYPTASSPLAGGTEPSLEHDWTEPSFERDWPELERAVGYGGRALPTTVRQMMEPRFGSDFSEVRVHDDQRAHKLASSIDARAFTMGNDVFFGRDGLQPGSAEGQKLIATGSVAFFDSVAAKAFVGSVKDAFSQPTEAGTKQVKEQVQVGTDLKSSQLIDAVANLIANNYRLILKAPVERKILKKA